MGWCSLSPSQNRIRGMLFIITDKGRLGGEEVEQGRGERKGCKCYSVVIHT
jgi:hypothetical protein